MKKQQIHVQLFSASECLRSTGDQLDVWKKCGRRATEGTIM